MSESGKKTPSATAATKQRSPVPENQGSFASTGEFFDFLKKTNGLKRELRYLETGNLNDLNGPRLKKK
jgi:hypothetical protein